MPSPHDVRDMHIGGALIAVKDALNRVSILASGDTLPLVDRFLLDEELGDAWNQLVDISSKNRAAIVRIEREQRRWTAKKLRP